MSQENIKTEIKYIIFQIDRTHLAPVETMSNKENRCVFVEVEFKGWTTNSFDSMEEAIEALVSQKMMWSDYIILPSVKLIEIYL